MNKNNKPLTQNIEMPAFDGSVPTELSADYILPDTYPDVKKILRTTARPVLIGRYISGRRLEFSGAVDYIIVFCADGENGESVHSVHFAGEWNGAVGELDDLDTAEISVTPRITACTARLANPRKLSLRSTVSADVKVRRLASCTPRCEGAATMEEELKLERLTETVSSGRHRSFMAEPLRISENLEPDSSEPPIDSIIACKAEIRFHEARPVSDDNGFTAALKGTAYVDCIYKSAADSGVYRSFERKIPISYIVSADDVSAHFENCRPDSLTARAEAIPVELNAAVGEDNYGERRVVELDLTADVAVHIMGSEEVPLVLDMYSTERDCECELSDIDYTAPAKLYTSNFSVGENLSREELKLPEGASIINATAEVTAGTLSIERGRGTLTGSAAVSCIYADGAGGFGSAEAALPIKYEFAAGDVNEPIAFVCGMNASDMRVRIDNDRVYFDFEVSLDAEVCEKKRRRTVNAIRLIGEPRRALTDASMTLCYMTPGDTLWEIAKRYNTTVGAIEAANCDGGRVLMIPRRSVGIVI